MKHRATESAYVAIARALMASDISLSNRTVEGLALHLEAVLAANRTHNLTAIADIPRGAELHVADSLTALPEIADAPPGSLVDMGSGAGYPGIPLALATGRPTTLVESIGKKARFLRDVSAELSSFGVLTVVHGRVELLGRDERRASFAVATARAVSSLASLVELASPLLMAGGWLVAFKGPVDQEELGRGKVAGRRVGMVFRGARRLMLPGGQARSIVTFERSEAMPEIRVPRSPGSAQHKPLA